LHVGFLAPISHCVIRKFGYLQKLGHFPLELCPNSGLGKFRRGKSIALSTKLVVVGDAENAGMKKIGTVKNTVVEKAGRENAGPNCRGGKLRTGKRGTKFHRGGKIRTTVYGTRNG